MIADILVTVYVIATILGIIYVSCVKSENRDLKEYLEFYKKQLKATLVSLERSNACLQEVVDENGELCERYRELLDIYARAYEILEENGLLPGGEE